MNEYTIVILIFNILMGSVYNMKMEKNRMIVMGSGGYINDYLYQDNTYFGDRRDQDLSWNVPIDSYLLPYDYYKITYEDPHVYPGSAYRIFNNYGETKNIQPYFDVVGPLIDVNGSKMVTSDIEDKTDFDKGQAKNVENIITDTSSEGDKGDLVYFQPADIRIYPVFRGPVFDNYKNNYAMTSSPTDDVKEISSNLNFPDLTIINKEIPNTTFDKQVDQTDVGFNPNNEQSVKQQNDDNIFVPDGEKAINKEFRGPVFNNYIPNNDMVLSQSDLNAQNNPKLDSTGNVVNQPQDQNDVESVLFDNSNKIEENTPSTSYQNIPDKQVINNQQSTEVKSTDTINSETYINKEFRGPIFDNYKQNTENMSSDEIIGSTDIESFKADTTIAGANTEQVINKEFRGPAFDNFKQSANSNPFGEDVNQSYDDRRNFFDENEEYRIINKVLRGPVFDNYKDNEQSTPGGLNNPELQTDTKNQNIPGEKTSYDLNNGELNNQMDKNIPSTPLVETGYTGNETQEINVPQDVTFPGDNNSGINKEIPSKNSTGKEVEASQGISNDKSYSPNEQQKQDYQPVDMNSPNNGKTNSIFSDSNVPSSSTDVQGQYQSVTPVENKATPDENILISGTQNQNQAQYNNSETQSDYSKDLNSIPGTNTQTQNSPTFTNVQSQNYQDQSNSNYENIYQNQNIPNQNDSSLKEQQQSNQSPQYNINNDKEISPGNVSISDNKTQNQNSNVTVKDSGQNYSTPSPVQNAQNQNSQESNSNNVYNQNANSNNGSKTSFPDQSNQSQVISTNGQSQYNQNNENINYNNPNHVESEKSQTNTQGNNTTYQQNTSPTNIGNIATTSNNSQATSSNETDYSQTSSNFSTLPSQQDKSQIAVIGNQNPSSSDNSSYNQSVGLDQSQNNVLTSVSVSGEKNDVTTTSDNKVVNINSSNSATPENSVTYSTNEGKNGEQSQVSNGYENINGSNQQQGNQSNYYAPPSEQVSTTPVNQYPQDTQQNSSGAKTTLSPINSQNAQSNNNASTSTNVQSPKDSTDIKSNSSPNTIENVQQGQNTQSTVGNSTFPNENSKTNENQYNKQEDINVTNISQKDSSLNSSYNNQSTTNSANGQNISTSDTSLTNEQTDYKNVQISDKQISDNSIPSSANSSSTTSSNIDTSTDQAQEQNYGNSKDVLNGNDNKSVVGADSTILNSSNTNMSVTSSTQSQNNDLTTSTDQSNSIQNQTTLNNKQVSISPDTSQDKFQDKTLQDVLNVDNNSVNTSTSKEVKQVSQNTATNTNTVKQVNSANTSSNNSTTSTSKQNTLTTSTSKQNTQPNANASTLKQDITNGINNQSKSTSTTGSKVTQTTTSSSTNKSQTKGSTTTVTSSNQNTVKSSTQNSSTSINTLKNLITNDTKNTSSNTSKIVSNQSSPSAIQSSNKIDTTGSSTNVQNSDDQNVKFLVSREVPGPSENEMVSTSVGSYIKNNIETYLLVILFISLI